MGFAILDHWQVATVSGCCSSRILVSVYYNLNLFCLGDSFKLEHSFPQSAMSVGRNILSSRRLNVEPGSTLPQGN
jgi:hypothetical protein